MQFFLISQILRCSQRQTRCDESWMEIAFTFLLWGRRLNLNIKQFWALCHSNFNSISTSMKSFRKNLAVSLLTPIAPKTIAKLSSCESKTSFPDIKPACLHICAPIYCILNPLLHYVANLMPKTMESSVLLLLYSWHQYNLFQSICLCFWFTWIICLGYVLQNGFIGSPSMLL